MANNVNSAFTVFLRDTINLDPEQTKKARGSRDWLRSNINNFSNNDKHFPEPYSEKDINFGSFARRTKKRPLDDIDMMFCLSGEGATYTENTQNITISGPSPESNLSRYCFEGSDIVNSTKIINRFIYNLKNVAQYQYADTKRNGEAATLKLVSYPWNFDIVPCFFTKEDNQGNTYYLIPDGAGNWKKTNPKVDQERTTQINQNHNGRVLNIIRIMKYWNGRATMPSMGSYLLENIIINYYKDKFLSASEYIDIEIRELFFISAKPYLTLYMTQKAYRET